jgi:serine phosphatase RsbU (regulator of sigma subunit)
MSAAAIPSEFDYELRSERSRWLRRRLMWLCATGIALTLILDGPDISSHLSAADAPHRHAGIVNLIECICAVAMYTAAFVYTRVIGLHERPLLRLVFRLLVAVAVVELLSRRLIDDILFVPGVDNVPGLTPASLTAWVMMFVLAFDHFLACLLMPWTVREALRPAAVFLVMFAISVLWDRVVGRMDSAPLLTIPGLFAFLLPGLAICWLRHRSFKRGFKLQFESSRYRELQGELASARRLHDAALPPQRTDGPIRLHYAYEPMRQIGGDLLFVNQPTDKPGVLSVVLLDVTGHGIAAALTVNRLIGELERLFAENPDAEPCFILRALNRYISLTLSRHSIYATALCLRVNCESGVLEWANAGHPPAFLFKADGQVHTLDSGATLLGVLDAEDFEVPTPPSPTTLAPGDVLVAYTDGLSEAASPEGKQLGTEGIRGLLTGDCHGKQPANAWPDCLLQSALNYRQAPVEDDTLILTLYRI